MMPGRFYDFDELMFSPAEETTVTKKTTVPRGRRLQRTSCVRYGTPNKTGARSYSLSLPPAVAEAVPAGTIFWAELQDDGSILYRRLGRAGD